MATEQQLGSHADPSGSPSAARPTPAQSALNAPNVITTVRLFLAFVVFAMISWTEWWITTTVLFIVAVLTDVLDGYLARKNNQITVFGRVMDPFVDKVIICGSFLFLIPHEASGVTTWMTLALIVREMFVTSLRSILEQRGKDFSAKLTGKLKMLAQSIAVPFSLLSMSAPFLGAIDAWMSADTFRMLRDVLLWATVAITLYSGIEYTVRGIQILREPPTPTKVS
jgi:CDP-diacylglycerol--glycerol-3-phosphate 3-phosphatidyltransferase